MSLAAIAGEGAAQSRSDTLAVLEAAASGMAAQEMAIGTVSPNPPCYRAACPPGTVRAVSERGVHAFAVRAGAQVLDLGDAALVCPATGAGRCQVKGGQPFTRIAPPVFAGDSAVVDVLQLLGGRQTANGKRMVWERTVRVDLVREGGGWTVTEVRVTRQS